MGAQARFAFYLFFPDDLVRNHGDNIEPNPFHVGEGPSRAKSCLPSHIHATFLPNVLRGTLVYYHIKKQQVV